MRKKKKPSKNKLMKMQFILPKKTKTYFQRKRKKEENINELQLIVVDK